LLLADDHFTEKSQRWRPLSDRGAMTRAAESPYKGETGLKRVLSATRNSLAGLTEALRHEDAHDERMTGADIIWKTHSPKLRAFPCRKSCLPRCS
jgi:hypothetical protein